MIKINKATDLMAVKKELREFGFIFGVMFTIVFGVLLPWIIGNNYPLWPWWVFIIFASLAQIYPLSLKLPYKLWMLFGNVMGWLNTRIILGLIFYFVFLPYGLIMKLLGKDPLSRRIDSKMTSYRNTNNKNKRYNMEDPF